MKLANRRYTICTVKNILLKLIKILKILQSKFAIFFKIHVFIAVEIKAGWSTRSEGTRAKKVLIFLVANKTKLLRVSFFYFLFAISGYQLKYFFFLFLIFELLLMFLNLKGFFFFYCKANFLIKKVFCGFFYYNS